MLGSKETKIEHYPSRVPCPSVQLWQGIVAAGYGNGQVRLYDATTGALHVQINAHARTVSALDLAPEVGKVSPCIPECLPGAEMHSTGLSPYSVPRLALWLTAILSGHSDSLPVPHGLLSFSSSLQLRTPLCTSGN